MTSDVHPLQKLRRLAAQEASGELICSGASAEVHVYLQRGRIAWATDSEHPFAFTRHLQQATQIDTESFRDILESCKREKRPLGETLVSWGAASWEDVRGALRHQIELALSVLGGDEVAQTLFLDRTRQFAPYNGDLTFDIEELVAEMDAQTPTSSKSPPPPLVSIDDPPPRSVHARRIFEHVEGVVWTELLDRTSLVEAMPPADASRVGCGAVESTVLDGAELVAIRSDGGTLAGVTLGDGHSLWCRLSADATFGVAISALSQLAVGARDESGNDAERETVRNEAWVVGAADAPSLGDLRDFVQRAPEVLAALVTGLDGEVSPCGVGRGRVDPERAMSIVRRRAKVLSCSDGPFRDASAPSAEIDTAGLAYRSLVIREHDVWCFGAELSTTPVRVVWLLVARASSQGLGWAYLTSLSRQLMRVRDWGRHG